MQALATACKYHICITWNPGTAAPGRIKKSESSIFTRLKCGERAGARTQDQRLKRAMLYQLSYPLAQENDSTAGRGENVRSACVQGRSRQTLTTRFS